MKSQNSYITQIILSAVLITVVVFNDSLAQDRSVQLPEDSIQDLNDVIDQANEVGETFGPEIEQMSVEYEKLYDEFDAATSSEEQQLIHEQIVNKRARLYSEMHDYFDALETVSGQVIHLAEDLAETDITNEELERKIADTVEELETTMAENSKQAQRIADIGHYANIKRETKAGNYLTSVDQKSQEMVDEIKANIGGLQDNVAEQANETENFSDSFFGQTLGLIVEAETMRAYSDTFLQLIEAYSTIELELTEFLNLRSTFAEVEKEFTTLTGDFNGIKDTATGIFNMSRDRGLGPESRLGGSFESEHSRERQPDSREETEDWGDRARGRNNDSEDDN